MLIHPHPDPIVLSIGPLHMHWYGFMYVVAFALFIVLGRLRMRQPHIAAQGWKVSDLGGMLSYGIAGVVLGGRMGEVLFYQPAHFLAHPLQIFMVWQGGMSFHGGLLGVMTAMCLWSRKAGRNVLDVYDFIAPLVPLGYAAGRLGNFINAELPGRLADPALPWAMIWPGLEGPRHPSPLYQMLVDGIFVFILLWFFARKLRPRLAVGAAFTLLYGCARFFTEYFRIPDYEVFIGPHTVSSGQMLSIPMIVGGLGMLIWTYEREYQMAQQLKTPGS